MSLLSGELKLIGRGQWEGERNERTRSRGEAKRGGCSLDLSALGSLRRERKLKLIYFRDSWVAQQWSICFLLRASA